MNDQFILYDQSILTWLSSNLAPLAKGRDTQILISTSRKAFAEVTSGQLVDNRRLKLPRIAVQRLDHSNNPDRYNKYRIRRLGWCNPPDGDIQKRIRSANYPAPITMNYQIDLATRYVSEMNRWEQYLLQAFAPQYIYLTIKPDDIYGNKSYAIFIDGPILDNSELEPGEGERAIRRTLNLRSEARIYDQNFVDVKVAKRIELQWRNFDDNVLLETQFLPPEEVFGTGNASLTTFAGTLERIPILEDSIVVETVIGGTTELAYDDGNGAFIGTALSSGTINYTTGAISVTWSTAPDSGASIKTTYFTDVEA